LLLALELGHHSASEVVHACHGLGLLVNAPRPSCLRLMPRLNSTPAEVEQGMECLAEGLEACRAG
jgi:acetylornithine/N-succinyldiaminopimelate aminotransferase